MYDAIGSQERAHSHDCAESDSWITSLCSVLQSFTSPPVRLNLDDLNLDRVSTREPSTDQLAPRRSKAIHSPAPKPEPTDKELGNGSADQASGVRSKFLGGQISAMCATKYAQKQKEAQPCMSAWSRSPFPVTNPTQALGSACQYISYRPQRMHLGTSSTSKHRPCHAVATERCLPSPSHSPFA